MRTLKIILFLVGFLLLALLPFLLLFGHEPEPIDYDVIVAEDGTRITPHD